MQFFKKVFGKKETAQSDVKTAPLSEEQLKTVTKESVMFKPPQFVVGTGQSSGKQRDHNEDTLFVMNSLVADNAGDLPFGIFIVADGMGGHQNGEVASGFAARAVAQHLVSKLFFSLMGTQPGGQEDSLQEIMEASVHDAQQIVTKRAEGGGTTLTVALVIGEQVTIAHVGDSRAYFIYADGRMQAITQDHSLVRRLVELGQLTEEEALVYPQRNVLYRAVGQGEPYKPDIYTYQFPHPGYLMLCSDGLWGVVPEVDIFKMIASSSTPSEACQKMIDAANNAGGPDNISVILVHYLN